MGVGKRYSNFLLTTLLSIFSLFSILTLGNISGSLRVDNPTIQQTNVGYTFALNIQTVIPANGKLVIRFPSDYTTNFFTNCAPISGFSGTVLTCSYLQTTRMLTITGRAFPNNKQQIQFLVSGVMNPYSVRTTGAFSVSLYSFNGTNYVIQETGGNGLQMTTTTGAVTQQSLKLQNPTVGVYSDLKLLLIAEHQVDSNGVIQLTLPKWNAQDPNQANWQSLISVPTSPGAVECSPVQGIYSLNTACTFTVGTTTDQLKIQLAETANVTTGTVIEVLIQNVRAPPSLTPLTGFTLFTTTNNGQVIDTYPLPAQIVLLATKVAQGTTSGSSIVVYPTGIQQQSSIQLSFQNSNPLLSGSGLQITVPRDFNVTQTLLKVTTVGENLQANPVFEYSPITRIITLTNVYMAYMQPQSFSYINMAGFINPAQTGQTASFMLQFTDQSNEPIEKISQGFFFSATPSSFQSVSVSPNNLFVSAQQVSYAFSLVPMNIFSKDAILKLTFPSQIRVWENSYLDSVGPGMNPQAQVQVLYNQVVYIRKAFPNGYVPNAPIEFALLGLQNPMTSQPTPGIAVQLFYDENTNQIDNYFGGNLTITAKAAPGLAIGVTLSNDLTGQFSSQFLITGSTLAGKPIAQGSSLLVFIPKDFTIDDPSRVASSCTAVSGFSDQITCYFNQTDPYYGAFLFVNSGFNSQNFIGGSFSFYLSNIQNPFTTEPTDAFSMQVFDSSGNLEYFIDQSQTPFTTSVYASEFSYAFVQSGSPKNGVSSIYTVTITLNINTPTGATLIITLPNQLQFDKNMPFVCNGTLNVLPSTTCYQRGQYIVTIKLIAEETFQNMFLNGTTLQFTFGYIINPLSLAPTQNILLQTFTTGGYLINSQNNGLFITNTQQGTINVFNISQTGSSQLNQSTAINFQMTTQNALPPGASITITVPTNFQLSSNISVTVNNQNAINPSINLNTYTITFTTTQSYQKRFNIQITSGLINPRNGPYTYSQFTFQTSYQSYNVDYFITNQDWINVQCSGNCTQCSATLNGCQSCGLVDNQAFFLFNQTCLPQCPKGFYNAAGYTCEPCSSPCLECSLGPELCTKCDPSKGKPYADLNTLSCYENCPGGTYLDKTKNQCIGCESPCYECSSASVCLTCDLGDTNNTAVYFYDQNSSCLNDCPDTTVPSPSKVCVDCEPPCKTCLNLPDICLSCLQGLYYYKSQCVSQCPFMYYQDNTLMQCKSIASLNIPFPFTILAFVMSVGVAVSSFMKGNHKSGQGTVFFITCLAFVDILLRINWFIFGILALQAKYYYTFFGCVIILATSMFLNLAVWRRFFKFKYNFEHNDKLFKLYESRYPRTARWLIFFSYFLTFQAIRLTYSRLLSKKQFGAEFSRAKVYYRLIGRLSIMEIFLVYIPDILLNLYGFFYQFSLGDQIFYLGFDSLALVAYATVLIVVTLTQREKLLDQKDLFEWCELCRCKVPSDDEEMYEEEDGGLHIKGYSPGRQGTHQYFDAVSMKNTQHLDEIELDVMSAAGIDDIKRQKRQLYQTEHRDGMIFAPKKDIDIPIPVNLVDYNLYKNLEEKVNRIVLKRNLYENRRINDYNDLQDLRGNYTNELQSNENLQKVIEKLRLTLRQIESQISQTETDKENEIRALQEKKKREVINRNSATEQSQHPFTLNSIQGSVQSQGQQLFNLGVKQSSTDEKQFRQSEEVGTTDEQQDGPMLTVQQTEESKLEYNPDTTQTLQDHMTIEEQMQRQSFGPSVINSNFATGKLNF